VANAVIYNSAIDGLVLHPRKHSASNPEVIVDELVGLGQYQIRARLGRYHSLAQRVASSYKRSKPLAPSEARIGAYGFIAATGPEEFWAMTTNRATGRTLAKLETFVADDASVFDQSHGRCVVRISGGRSADVLAKGIPLDLLSPALPPQWAAHTTLEHIPALILKREAVNTFDVSFARSYASSFTHWLSEAAAEYD